MMKSNVLKLLILIVFCFFGMFVYGDMKLNIKYVDNYNDIGIYDVDVLVNDNFRLDSDKFEVTSLPDDFKMFAACEGLDGSILNDCNEYGKRIGYINPEKLTVSSVDGELQEIPGEIVLTFREAATLKDGTNVDIIVTINNIKIKRNREDIELNRPVVVLRQGDKFISNEANSVRSGFSVNYDIAFELRRNGTLVKNLTMGIIFSDIDIYHEKYAEAINLLWGVKDDKVYRLNGSEDYLCINEKNTKFTTAKVCGLTTEEKQNFTEEEEKLKGGFALKVKSDGFKYNWTGSGCGTDISFLTVENPPTGNVSKIIMVFVLFIVSGTVMFIFLRKFN